MAESNDLAAVWLAATDEIADGTVSAQQRAYLRLTSLRAVVEDTALEAVPDAITRHIIESRARPAGPDALARRLGRSIQVAVTVRPPEETPGSAPVGMGTSGLASASAWARSRCRTCRYRRSRCRRRRRVPGPSRPVRVPRCPRRAAVRG